MTPTGGALAVEAARVDGNLQEHGARMETLHHQLLDAAAASSSPLERAALRRQAYDVSEAGGAIRFSAITGSDDSDLG